MKESGWSTRKARPEGGVNEMMFWYPEDSTSNKSRCKITGKSLPLCFSSASFSYRRFSLSRASHTCLSASWSFVMFVRDCECQCERLHRVMCLDPDLER
jgi:hypothetical protein